MNVNKSNHQVSTINKQKKPPPINIELQDPKDTAKLISEELGQIEFHIKRLNKNKHLLQLSTLESYNKTKELLTKTDTKFYSYTPKESKLPTFLLKSLHNSYSENEILQDLQKQRIENIAFKKVSRFTTRRSIENNIIT